MYKDIVLVLRVLEYFLNFSLLNWISYINIEFFGNFTFMFYWMQYQEQMPTELYTGIINGLYTKTCCIEMDTGNSWVRADNIWTLGPIFDFEKAPRHMRITLLKISAYFLLLYIQFFRFGHFINILLSCVCRGRLSRRKSNPGLPYIGRRSNHSAILHP